MSVPTPVAVQRLRRQLSGVWRGRGSVLPASHPQARPPLGAPAVPYVEEVRFWTLGPGKPVLGYSQRTRHADSGVPLHTETGFWRLLDDGRAEMALAQPFAVAEVSEGSVEEVPGAEADPASAGEQKSDAENESSEQQEPASSGFKVHLRTTGIVRGSSGKPPAVRELVRTFWLSSDGRRLRYTVDMATDRIPEPELHLEACLERVPDAEE